MSTDVSCPLCGSTATTDFLERRSVPIHLNFLMNGQEDAMKVERGDLVLAACHRCGFVFNRAFDPTKVLYGEGYDNARTHSPSYDRYLDELVEFLVDERQVRDARIIEIGCGNGQFLERLVARHPGNTGRGFDPSYRGPPNALHGRLRFENRPYDGDGCNETDVVICRHVIEHLPHPGALLASVGSSLKARSDARIFFETPCVEWILRGFVFWDFFYEHCSYFSQGSLTFAFHNAGLCSRHAGHVFDGQYLWLEASPAANDDAPEPTLGEIPSLARRFAREEQQRVHDWQLRLGQCEGAGPLALWGAAAKGVTFANLLDPARERITCIVDINPAKQGRFIPGTGHPIVSVHDLHRYGIRCAIVMNPIYEDEIRELLAGTGLDIELLSA